MSMLRQTQHDLLSAVDGEIFRALSSEDPRAREVSRYLMEVGGKRLRPLLVMTVASIYRADELTSARVAAASELVHTASLIHDDMVDGAKSRRGRPALHQVWGPKVSVLTGDFLFSRAFSLLVRYGQFAILKLFADAVSEMCESEMEQADRRFRLDITEEECLAHTRRKTASLIQACCMAGGILGEAPQAHIDRFGDYGLNLGLAFQITDDVLDLAGDAVKMGKPVRLDIASGVLTLPVLFLLKKPRGEKKVKPVLEKGRLSPGEAELVREEAIASGAVQEALSYAGDCIAKATRALDGVPASPGRSRLEKLAQSVLEREI